MSLKKNNTANLLSRLDPGQVLQDAHNSAEHALDVTLVNSLVPARYSRVTCEMLDMGDGTFETEYINYYGFGNKESNQIEMVENPTGAKEKTNLNFTGLTTSIEGKFFTIYDSAGSVGVWYNLDSGSVPPTTGALRDIEIPIVTGDNDSAIALSTTSVVTLDPEFSAASVGSVALIEASIIGLRTDATPNTSGISISITTQGIGDLQSKYVAISNGTNTLYHFWFNIAGLGIDPTPVGSISIEVPLLGFESQLTAAAKLQAVMEDHAEFSAFVEDSFITISNAVDGASDGMVDGDTGMAIDEVTSGSDQDLVCRLRVLFTDKFISGIEKVI